MYKENAASKLRQFKYKHGFKRIKRNFNIFKRDTVDIMFGFHMNSERWSPKVCLQLQLIAKSVLRKNITQMFKITTLILQVSVELKGVLAQDPAIRSHDKALEVLLIVSTVSAPESAAVNNCRYISWAVVVMQNVTERLCQFHQFAGLHGYFHDDVVAASSLCSRASCCEQRHT